MVAETPSISGVWKANLDASNFGRMKPTGYLMIVQQQGNTIRETIGDTNMMGTYRSSFTFSTSAPDNRNSWRGMPMHSKAQWTDGALIVDSRVAGPRGQAMHDKYSLSADGNTLTIERTTTREGKDTTQTIVLTRQANEAGEPQAHPAQSLRGASVWRSASTASSAMWSAISRPTTRRKRAPHAT